MYYSTKRCFEQYEIKIKAKIVFFKKNIDVLRYPTYSKNHQIKDYKVSDKKYMKSLNI